MSIPDKLPEPKQQSIPDQASRKRKREDVASSSSSASSSALPLRGEAHAQISSSDMETTDTPKTQKIVEEAVQASKKPFKIQDHGNKFLCGPEHIKDGHWDSKISSIIRTIKSTKTPPAPIFDLSGVDAMTVPLLEELLKKVNPKKIPLSAEKNVNQPILKIDVTDFAKKHGSQLKEKLSSQIVQEGEKIFVFCPYEKPQQRSADSLLSLPDGVLGSMATFLQPKELSNVLVT